ncbi:hypothetical protein C8F01DRAFT_1374343 [Mycena amicta]|nr:hypothetical protein C8F01DRAFT_1374343 [Mycena amicta]
MQTIQRRSFYAQPNYYKYKSPVKNFGKARRPTAPVPLPASLQTFDPRQITPNHHFNIADSGLSNHFRKLASQTIHDPHPLQFGEQIGTRDTPFPPNTHGFLYYFSPKDQHPLAGALRFRLAKEPTRHAFLNGTDLLMEHGIPWALPIWEIITLRVYENLFKMLIRDGFAPLTMQTTCNSLDVSRDSVFMTALGIPWATDFSYEHSRLYICANPMHPIPLMIHHPWFNRKVSKMSPISGRAILSIVQQPDCTYGLRVNKILRLNHETQVSGTTIPTEGQITPLRVRAVVRTTKITEAKLVALESAAVSPIRNLPWAKENPNPLDVYQHTRWMPSTERERAPPPHSRASNNDKVPSSTERERAPPPHSRASNNDRVPSSTERERAPPPHLRASNNDRVAPSYSQ